MLEETTKETYIWDNGFERPSEQERMMTFVCSCIEDLADKLGCKPSDAYRRMQKIGLIQQYIIPCYDTLHTESRESVSADILETLKYWEENKKCAVC